MNSPALDASGAVTDLGPLAWVLDELRKSLDGSAKALKRFVREAEAARGSDLAALDASQLRIARQQLHQAVGALEMVGLSGPALVLRAMEAAVQKFVQQPQECSQEAAAKIERASFALSEYLEAVLANKPISPVALFPQYREVQQLVKADRVHPADLWPYEWRWHEPQLAETVEPRNYDDPARTVLDQSVLQLMKGAAPDAAKVLKQLSLGFSATQTDSQPRIFWKIAAAYFEAQEHSALTVDLYVRRASSRILMQYSALSKGDAGVSDRLAQDLLFFCAQAGPFTNAGTPVLKAVQSAFGLMPFKSVNYEAVQFGRFDPALLAQARKRISSAKEIWSSLSAGDANKFKSVVDQFGLVSDSLVKLHPPSELLAQALTSAIEITARSNKPPPVEMAMEVATSVLYLEAAFEDLDPNDPQLAARTRHLAERLDGVKNGGHAQPLESWMEDLYRRVSDKQTMGSVVGELRISLGEIEKSLDAFFRNPEDRMVLRDVPGQLAQMRGVLSVLGLDQASQAVLRMRDSVESMLETDVDEELARAAGKFDQLGNNVGALSFLIDMLNYQPVLAKKLFVYDDIKGELRPVMGRREKSAEPAVDHVENPPAVSLPEAISNITSDANAGASSEALAMQLNALATNAALAGQPDLAKSAQQASLAVTTSSAESATLAMSALAATVAVVALPAAMAGLAEEDLEEEDLLDIFLEEARDVARHGTEALALLAADPSDVSQLTILRRAFHTLKGSARMVGLNEFSEAAWSMEQLFNGWLADQRPASRELRELAQAALDGFSRWVDAIAAGKDGIWHALPFQTSADAMRVDGRYEPLALLPTDTTSRIDLAALAFELPSLDLPQLNLPDAGVREAAESQAQVANTLSDGIDFSILDMAVEAAILPAEPIAEFERSLPEVAPALEATPDLTESELQELFEGSAKRESASLGTFEPLGTVETVETVDPNALEITGIDLDSLAALSGTAALNAMEPNEAQTTGASEDADLRLIAEMEALQKQLDSFELEAGNRGATGADVIDFDLQFDEPSLVSASAIRQLGSNDIKPKNFLDSAAIGAQTVQDGTTPSNSVAGEDSLAENSEEQVKVIGELRIGLALFNVYLNEADEWSRRLVTEVAEWALERSLPPTDSMIALAHSLAGSSATVGFVSLSDMARAFEHSLEQSHLHYDSTAASQYADLFVQVADDIRRLLHQFAAGFVKDGNPELLSKLQQLEFSEASSITSMVLDDAEVDKLLFESVPAAEQSRISDATTLASTVKSTADFHELSTPSPAGSFMPAAGIAVATAAAFVAPAFVSRPDLSPSPASSGANANPAHAATHDELDAVDAIDPELFPIFDEEAAELMPQLGGALRQWAARPDNANARLEVLRVLHTLKGSARLSGAMRLGEVAHNIETEIEFLGSDAASSQQFEPLLARFDTMELMLEKLRNPGAAETDEKIAGLKPAESPAFETVQAANEAINEPVEATFVLPAADKPVLSEPGSARQTKALVPAPQLMAMQPLRQAANASIRVRSQLLDRMVNQAGEVMITRSRLEGELNQLRGSLGDMNDNLNRLRQHLKDIELQAETQMQSRLAQAKEQQGGFDPLEFDRFTRVQELTRMMAESVNDVATVQRTLQRTVEATEDDLIAQARQTRELQRDLLRTRMVEFESISDRLYRVVRLASKETGKQVKLDLLGSTIEMDRGMLDRMTPAFEHLLRNCVGHGIESSETRLAAGKDAVGTITVHLRQEGNDVSVEFSDDGAGLDLDRIREKAISSGLMTADQLMDDKQAANLIFMPGFSTASQVTELSGRGIGMDVVRSDVNAVGGRIETFTTRGKGSQFKLVLPLTTAVTQVVMIRAGKLTVGVPANVVDTVRRVTGKELQQAYNSGVLDVAGEQVPFFWSGALLQASRQSVEAQAKTTSVIVFRSAAQRIAMHVDEVLGNQEVVVKNLGPQLARLPGLAGMSVLASGAVVLIYNPVALASVYGEQARVLSADLAEPHVLEALGNADGAAGAPAKPVALAPAAAQIPLIMVVDDSITVRRVTQRMLLREGYRVVMAADGLQALEKLADEVPVVVLSDIEMPRMDGFDLARNIRGDARLKALPIIMITSRIAEKHREHAKELGVDHYLGKPYSEDELMGLVRYYCGLEVKA
jgi:chemosensory pili system protein ChpA (sensor histidine kinase/response regulator)